MTWAGGRQTFIIVIVLVVIAAIAALTTIAALYETPSCSDGKQNQDEEGIDCGGSCALVCNADARDPVLSYVRDVPGPAGRTDVVAFVDNQNTLAAAKGARYTVELYGEDRTVLATKEGTVDLPPSSGVPIYIPNVYSGPAVVAQAFLEFDEDSIVWYRYDGERALPRVSGIEVANLDTAPRLHATISSETPETMRNVRVVAIVFDTDNTVVAASQTLIGELPGLGSAPAVFTWTAPFAGTPARIDVRAVIPLE